MDARAQSSRQRMGAVNWRSHVIALIAMQTAPCGWSAASPMDKAASSLLAGCPGIASLGGLAGNRGVPGTFYYQFCARRRNETEFWKCQPERFLTVKQYRAAIFAGRQTLSQHFR